jgi:hypothetical protein
MMPAWVPYIIQETYLNIDTLIALWIHDNRIYGWYPIHSYER